MKIVENMEPKRVSSIALARESYPWLKKPKHPNHVDKVMYRKIVKGFLEKIMKAIIVTGDKIRLPKLMGALQAVRYKTDHRPVKPIDYHNTKKLYGDHNAKAPKDAKKTVRHYNRSTDGYWVRIHWYKRWEYKKASRQVIYGTKFTNSRNIIFKPSRPNLRPNSYNKTNPEVSLYPYFKNHMWNKYTEL